MSNVNNEDILASASGEEGGGQKFTSSSVRRPL